MTEEQFLKSKFKKRKPHVCQGCGAKHSLDVVMNGRTTEDIRIDCFCGTTMQVTDGWKKLKEIWEKYKDEEWKKGNVVL